MAEADKTTWTCDHCQAVVELDLGDKPVGWVGMQIVTPVEGVVLTSSMYHLCADCNAIVVGWVTENWEPVMAPEEVEEEPVVEEEEVVDDGTEPEPEPAP